jgi:phenylalanyl-tRNA synthetase beta chain
MGIVNSKLLKAFDIDNPVYFADLDWNMLLRLNKQYKPVINDLPKFPEVKRDFALLVDQSVKFADLAKAALATEKKLLKAVTLFDVYEGKNLEEGKKSYAVSFVLQDDNQTLNDKVIDKTMARLMESFEKRLGAVQR